MGVFFEVHILVSLPARVGDGKIAQGPKKQDIEGEQGADRKPDWIDRFQPSEHGFLLAMWLDTGKKLTEKIHHVRGRAFMEHFIAIMTKPDNIALVVMFFLTIVTVWAAVREMLINDRLIKNGERDKIYERMTKFD